MDGRIRKLAYKIDKESAQKLVEAGLDTPAKIKAAADKDIETVVGKDKLTDVRARMPKLEG